MLDGRPIRTEVDKGFREGRQYGRGATGGQVRDDMRMTFDAGRGGLTAASSGAQRTVVMVPLLAHVAQTLCVVLCDVV